VDLGNERPPAVEHQPQPQEMALARRIRVVLEARAIVEHHAVVEEDHLAGLQHERELHVVTPAHLLEEVERGELVDGERGAELLGGHLDVGAQPDHAQHALALGEHGDAIRRDRRLAG
jgi:hypothetical protein